MIRNYASTNLFLGQEGPGFLKLGPVSVGALANREEFGVLSLRLPVIAGQLDGFGEGRLQQRFAVPVQPMIGKILTPSVVPAPPHPGA
jgi:hypothetical protein